VELAVRDARGRPALGTAVTASVAGHVVDAAWAGDATGRVRGVPFLREESVELTVRADGQVVVSWTGRLGTDPRDVLYADVDLPAFGGPSSGSLFGVGGGASGEFRGRARRRTPDASGRLEVAVVGRDGSAVAHARVRVRPSGATARADARGHAVFPALEAAAYEVETWELGVVTARGSVTVDADRTSRVTLQEPEGGTLDVEVVDEAGVPLPFATLALLGDRDWCDLESDGTQRTDPHTDHLGRRTLTRVAAGDVRVQAWFGRRTGDGTVEVRDARRTALRLVVR
jgi:hypothetical protein